MRTSDLPEVRQLDLFRTMGESNFEALMQAAFLQTFPASVDLITAGDPADFLFIVIEGAVQLFGTANGRESTLSMVRPVGSFILAAVLKDAAYLMSARTIEKSRILMIPAQNIREAFEEDEAFSRAIVVELANCYRIVVKELKNQKLRTSVERLANRLLRYNIEQGLTGEITLPYDKRTLASLLGMTPENLSRAFNTLQPYGVAVDGATVTLSNPADLEILAKPDPLIDDRST